MSPGLLTGGCRMQFEQHQWLQRVLTQVAEVVLQPTPEVLLDEGLH